MKTLPALVATLALISAALVAPPTASAQPSAEGLKSGMQAGLSQVDKTLDKIGATPDQKTKIKAILFDAFTSLGPATKGVKGTVQTFGAAVTGPAVDRAELERSRIQLVADFDAVTRVIFKAIGDSAEVLTPEQRAKLAAMAKKKGG